MEQRFSRMLYILIAFTLIYEMSLAIHTRDNNKKRIKEKSGGFHKNICDITDRDSKVHCYCENTRELRNATLAECWVFNGGIPKDDLIWESFASQPRLQTLSFNVRVDGALGYIPTKTLQYLQRIQSINIKYGNIVDINSFAFANLTDLKEITLSVNQVETLEPYAFAHLPNITVINLEENMILDISKNTFFDVPNLQKLVLTKNNISSISDGAFQHTFNLLELELNRNSIHRLSRRLFDGLANLRKLDLRRNHIYNLTEFTFAELWNLQELLLGKNDIKHISERAFDGLSQLQKLSLDDNKLASLPSGLFEGVRGLNSLDLRSNDLYSLTFDNVKPILDNLKMSSSYLLIEENNFICDCRLKWMYSLRNETKSQNTKDSLNGVTCKVDTPIVSSAYMKMGHNEDSYKKEQYNSNNSEISTNKTEAQVNDVTTLKGIRRSVLKISPDSLPCPVEKRVTTESSAFVVGSMTPKRNEMNTFRLQQMNGASKVAAALSTTLWSWFVLIYN